MQSCRSNNYARTLLIMDADQVVTLWSEMCYYCMFALCYDYNPMQRSQKITCGTASETILQIAIMLRTLCLDLTCRQCTHLHTCLSFLLSNCWPCLGFLHFAFSITFKIHLPLTLHSLICLRKRRGGTINCHI